MNYRIDVEVVAPVFPTEDPERVSTAITNLFPNATVDHAHGEIHATAHAVDHFANLLAKQRIVDTARTQLLAGSHGDTISFRLRKQPAFVGVVNFAIDDPAELGDISIRIRVEQPSVDRFIEHVTPPTDADESP